jgi:hypothetical protein
MSEQALSGLPFELAYLALLTGYGLKRLSRWEGALGAREVSVLRGLGLHVAGVERRTLLGRRKHEVVFSRTPRPTSLYLSSFDGRRLSSAPKAMRLEGFLFGYPSCCVEEFIRHAYSKNDLTPEDQRILFHWACPGCLVTPGLLRDYRLIHRECRKLFGGNDPAWEPARVGSGLRIPAAMGALQRKALPVALCLSALVLAPKVVGASDPHLLPVADDLDADYISFGEEILKGLDWHNPSTAPDTLLDGVALALEIKALIDSLPDSPQPDRAYKTYEYVYGIETCDICGEEVNMGYINVVHPLRGLSIEVPFIAYHFLEHGSLAYMGSVHDGRLDFSLLKRILLCGDDSHQNFTDWDEDGLDSYEEWFIGTADTIPDTDGDSVKDGPQYLEGIICSLSSISREVSDSEPYMIEHPMDGTETCNVCGNTYDMGHVELVNPLEDLTVDVHYVALHYLAHGSATYVGSYNVGDLLPTVVNSVVNGDGSSHWIEVEGDSDGDGLKDEEEAYFSMDPDRYDTDGDGVPDGPALARAMHAILDALPREEHPDSIYRIDHRAKGTYRCLVCGELVNMGCTDITNPETGETLEWLDFLTLHFMSHGSFATDRPELVGRVDPRLIDQVLGSPAYIPGWPPARQVLQVFPSPFVHRTRIVCSLPKPGALKVTIHDAAGRQVMEYPPVWSARHEILWDGTGRDGCRLAAGAYFIRLDLGSITLSKKVLLLR